MRRTLAVVLAVLGLVACVESDPSTIDVPATSSTAPAGQPATPTTATTAPPTRRTIIVGGTDAVPDPPTTAAVAPNRSANGPGSIADLILGPKGPPRLALQVLTQDGAEPRQATLNRLVDVLETVSGKPVRTLGGTMPTRGTWGSELRDDADAQRPALAADTLLLRFAFVHGQSSQGRDVLGISQRGDLSAVFVDQVDAAATGLVSSATIERAVAVHELGHLLGLVDLFLATGRADPAHPGHSTDRRSVMYWAVESSVVGDLLTGGPPQDFDAADLADLDRIRRG
ncbi:MAG: Membrane metalloprotease [Actinomycetia bacterium]|nr:Membrane metalloprotease [Actinomycetes bacterium]